MKTPPHNFTPEDSAKGGKSITVYKSLARTLGLRKKCTLDCVFFSTCPVSAMSYGYKDEKNPANDRKCLMKDFPHTVRQQFIDLFLTGEEGIIKSIKTALHNYMNDVEAYGRLQDKRDMIQLMLQFYDKVYNNQKKGAVKKEPLTITIRRVGVAPETISVMPHEALPPGKINVRDLNNPANDDITEDDPESLIHSPMVTELLRPVSRPVYMEEIKIETNFEEITDDERV
jgi:hypothetical protein